MELFSFSSCEIFAISLEISFALIEIRVADNGPGIPPEVREKLFNINLTTKPEGHGYGLMICKKIIENHNGKIEVISEVGNGTEFIISIPVE